MDGSKPTVATVSGPTSFCRAAAETVLGDPSSIKLRLKVSIGPVPDASSLAFTLGLGLDFAFSPLLKLQRTPYGGRSLFAAQAIPAGTLLHVCAAPHAHVVYRAFRKEVCARCFAYATQAQKRVQAGFGAGAPYFCGEACRDAWIVVAQIEQILADEAPEEHEEQLGITKNGTRPEMAKEQLDRAWGRVEAWTKAKYGRSGPPLPFALDEGELDIARFAVSAIVRRHQEADPPFAEPELAISRLLSLQDSELANVRMRPYLLRAHLRVCAFLGAALPPPLRAHVGVVRQLLARETGNAFGIWEGDQLPEGRISIGDSEKEAEDTRDMREREMFGWGVWVSASLFNHSCAPNVRKKRSGRSLEFFTLRDVKEGEELRISYASTDKPVGERREALRTSWFFDCMCSRCVRESS
ncbi:SET domain-containing protein [Coniophora puteana RWD-64-598 SS2]|uniref:SET domain-containing protein n=1 Tax=Coniophora puteana (strain RWD-64-598) TaxID=741705 RepID=A0A5M3MKE7_CONPW|nr:SET domain-containing protein [Coniophora puteana RWD-64-598 SS2]EIW79553.1 SET domain-containing protein [Coniophora puteana RWD-64-598 SS2]